MMPEDVQQLGGYKKALSSILVMAVLKEHDVMQTITPEMARERLEQWMAEGRQVSIVELAGIAEFLDEKRGGR
jgi:hypothetical protein